MKIGGTTISKIEAIAKDTLQMDAEDIYQAHMQCEGIEFLVAMLNEGIVRLGMELGDEAARLVIRGLVTDLL